MGTALIRRCDIFINMFEQKVAKVQQVINQLREMEKLYNITSGVVNKWTIENDVKVELTESCIMVNVAGISTDSCRTIASLAQSLQDKLVELELKTPEIFDGNSIQTNFYWSFMYKEILSKQIKHRSITLTYTVPEEGILDISWEKTTKTYSYEDRVLVSRNKVPTKINYDIF